MALGLKGTEKDLKIEETASTLADILDMDKDDVKEYLTAEKTLIKITKYRDRETADKVRKAGLDGIEVAEDVKRHYPLKKFCSASTATLYLSLTAVSGSKPSALSRSYRQQESEVVSSG